LKALILAGGFATRLRPLSCTRPKILFPIVNKPLLEWTFERLAKSNIREAIMAVSHQIEVGIKQQRIPKHGLHVTYSRDPLGKPLGSGGPIKKAEKHIGHESPFLVLNGDIFADVNYTEILKLHEKRKAVATIALHQVEEPSRYGVVRLTQDNRITEFVEKPPKGTEPTNLINAGVYVLSPEIFNYIQRNRAVSIEREVFTKLAQEGKLYGCVYDGLWMDIGKPEDYLEINKVLLRSIADKPKSVSVKDVEIRKPVFFDKRISVGRKSVIGPNVVLGREVIVGENARIQDSVIFLGTEIADFVSINGAIIGEGVSIGKNVKIDKGCILGDHVRIMDNTTLSEKVWVCPGKEISESVLTPRHIV
jgi:mannose-1-phosphate guanylyltransferase